MPDVDDLSVRDALVRLLRVGLGARRRDDTHVAAHHEADAAGQTVVHGQGSGTVGDAVRQVLRRGVADGVIDAEVDLDTALTSSLSNSAILVGMRGPAGYQAGSVSTRIWSTSFSTDCSAPAARATGS